MLRPRILLSALSLALVAAFAGACEETRSVEREGGIHPPGFADLDNPKGPDFHATYLKEQYKKQNAFPLATCRKCHGDDYGGGDASFSCNTANCHAPNGVEWCGTCHNGNAPPKPTSGAHGGHILRFGCETCHHVPKDAREIKHPDGQVEITLSGLSAHGGLAATWSAEDQTCTATYCHGDKSPRWDSPVQQLPCDTCHEAPPKNHAQFTASIGPLPDGCAGCHPKHDDPRHLNAQIDVLDMTCAACHGELPDGAPPRGIDGATVASAKTVGAHQRHLDPTLLDRMGKVVECTTCHTVPATVLATGHLDATPPADVSLFGGTYDPASQRCVVACHGDKDPGVVWTDTSGAPRKCDGCHAFPPAKTKDGVPHPQVPADPDLPWEAAVQPCLPCHNFQPATHVDGHVDFLP